MAQLKKQGKPVVKIVYGIINGRRTECMSEAEFRTRYCNQEYTRLYADQVDSEKILEGKGLRRALPRINPLEGAYKGRKDLAGTDLHHSDLKGVNLENADLSKANLDYCDLRGANLQNANLKGASLVSAYFKGANLRGADLTGAKCSGTYFQEANLLEVKGLTMEEVRSARSFYNADLDEELDLTIKAQCPRKLDWDPGWHWDTGKYDSKDEPTQTKANRKKFY